MKKGIIFTLLIAIVLLLCTCNLTEKELSHYRYTVVLPDGTIYGNCTEPNIGDGMIRVTLEDGRRLGVSGNFYYFSERVD